MHHPGVAPKWIAHEADVARMASAFGVTPMTGTIRLLGGAVNGVVLVSTSGGEIVFRIHRSWETVERLEAVHQVQHRLRQMGLPIPVILNTVDGRSWTRLRDRLIEAMPFAGAGHEADSEDEFSLTFATLGRLHHAFTAIPAATVPVPVFSSYADPPTALAMLAATDRAFKSGSGYEGYREASEVREDVRRLYTLLLAEHERYAGQLPSSLIHGDFLGMNVLLDNGEVRAILDFDRLAYRRRIVDIATSLSCAFSRLDRRQPSISSLRDDQLRQLAHWLEAYHATAPLPLTAEEGQALPFEMARVQLFPAADAGYLAAAGQHAEAIAQTRAVARHLPRGWWLVANAERVSAQATPSGL
jgi:Ser/Thr protein kinase RdoA (MazF antagonist)